MDFIFDTKFSILSILSIRFASALKSSLDKVTAPVGCNISKRLGAKFESLIIFSQNTNLNYLQN